MVSDFYQRIVPAAAPSHYLKVSRADTHVLGAIIIGPAVMVLRFWEANPDTDLLSIALGIMTFFCGGPLGIFLVGIPTTGRGNSVSNGLGVWRAVEIFLAMRTSLGWPWFTVVGTGGDRGPFDARADPGE